ncbi:MAG: PrsW family intramembrane metalloprotease [Proteobacteria bacterium]|nr:PrsW family intramembrane metalloprotease [Pseudomonadota bacterium]
MSATLLADGLIAVAPVLLLLAALVRGDSFRLVPLATVLGLIGVGAAAAGASYLANTLAYARYAGEFEQYSRHVAPWIEELLKGAVVAMLIRSRRIGLPVDAAIAGFAVGTGFALVENGYYLLSRPDPSLLIQTIRGFGTAIMHAGTTGVLAMVGVMLYGRRVGGGSWLLLPGLLAAVALHTGFNYLLVRPAFATLATVVVLPGVIYAIFAASERSLRAWLEQDLDSKVELLALIGKGEFLDSHQGRHLLALRDRFQGEHLADMLCLLRLHGELALRAKGELLLRESGLEVPPLDEETQQKLAEITALERAIGRTGMLALRPLMLSTGKDLWQLTLLRR